MSDTTTSGGATTPSGPVVDPSGMVFGRPPTRPGDVPPAQEDSQDPDLDPESELDPEPERVPEPEPDAVVVTEEPATAPELDDPGPAAVGDPVGAEPAEPVAASGALLGDGAALRQRWEAVQVGFVDDPDRAVTAARDMVTEVAAALLAEIERRRDELPGRGADPVDGSTDALLAAFHHYRDLFDRVVAV